MRLNEIRMIIAENIKFLPCELVNDNKNPNMKGLNNIASIMNAVNAIGKIPYFVKLVDEIQSLNEISSVHTDGLTWFSNNIAISFKNKVDLMSRESSTILRFINSTIPQMDKNTICVKLPDNITASEFQEIVDGFSFIFNTITQTEGNHDRVEISGVEAGSAWIYYIIGGSAISLPVILKVIHYALDVYKDYLEIIKINLEIKKLAGDNTAKGIENIEEIIGKKIEEALSKVQDDTHISLEGETYNRYFQVFKRLIKILETKTTIHPAITASKEEKIAYLEKIAEIDSITNGIQLLETATVSEDSMVSVQESEEKQDSES